MRKRVYALVSGRVQNVGFRMFVLAWARRLGLAGWVRNLPDGASLELEAEGEESAVEALITALWSGPRGARITDVHTEVRTPLGTDGGHFVVR